MNKENKNYLSQAKQNYAYFNEVKSFKLKDSLEYYNKLKENFKIKFKYHIAIYLGVNIMLVYISRDLPETFFNLSVFLKEHYDDKTLSLVYLFPNFVFPLFFGYITDYIGYHFGLIALHIPLILGNLFTMMSTFVNPEQPFSMETAIVGRLLFSFGGESLHIIFLSIIVSYFRKSMLVSFGLIICLSVGYVGFAISRMINIIEITQIPGSQLDEIPLFKISLIAFIFTIISLLWAGSLILFENYWKKIMRKESNQLYSEEELRENVSFLNDKEIYPYSFWQSFQNMLNIKMILIALMHAMIWGSFSCMMNYTKYFFETSNINIIELQKSIEISKVINSTHIGLTMLLLVRNHIDKFKQKNFYMVLGCLLNSFAYIVFSNVYSSYLKQTSITLLNFLTVIASIALGFGMGFFTAGVYSSIPMCVNEKNTTIGFGFVYSLTNVFKFFLLDITPSFAQGNHLQSFLLGKNPFWLLSCICIIMAVVLEIIEKKESLKAIR